MTGLIYVGHTSNLVRLS